MEKKQKYIISTFSEDFATNTEVKDVETGKIIDRLYIGATNWDCDQKLCAKQLNDFIQKYEKLNLN